ncbi:hypothetical protein OWM54_02115 [Myxococcus sp. MISCRS1]|uniref:hypothetical protein n=1 Tax=Myxococcus TaxID=32 RepID=UPI0011448189|nr:MULTISPECIES: hypothetical protein [Myxococcus]MCK8503907.1 hypothetical protein [Myxococcus fulvus]MCY0995928.1 hypothetical protein [Myxococcus sp. MISCRS1]
MPRARPITVSTWTPAGAPGVQVLRVEDDTRLWTGHATAHGLTVTYAGAFEPLSTEAQVRAALQGDRRVRFLTPGEQTAL